MPRRLLAPFAVIGLLLLLPAAQAGFKDPVAFVKALYALPDLWQSASGDAAARQAWLSPALAKLVADNKKREPEEQLDLDALADGQDYAITGLVVTLRGQEGKRATVRAEYKNFDERQGVTLELVMAGGEWRLDDIRYDDDRTLAEDLNFLNGN